MTTYKYDLPTTTAVSNQQDKAGQRISLTFGPSEDVAVLLPSEPIESLRINGGHNIVIEGGDVTLQDTKHACEFNDWTGELHLRDMHVDPGGRSGNEADAIRINSRHDGSIATLQRVRVDAVAGSYAGEHGDILQTWGGPSVVRVWKLTGYSTYQGFYLAPVHFDWHPQMARWEFEDVDLHGLDDGYKLWVLSGQGPGDFFSADNGSGALEITNCFYAQTDQWEKIGPGDAFYDAGVRYVDGALVEFVPARVTAPPPPDPEPPPVDPPVEPPPDEWNDTANSLDARLVKLQSVGATILSNATQARRELDELRG